MESVATSETSDRLRHLPPIDALLRTETGVKILADSGTKHLTKLARLVTDSLRRQLQGTEFAGAEVSRDALLAEAEKRLEKAFQNEKEGTMRRVINATGVVIHTNLGRAPLSDAARKAIAERSSQYCNLEYDLETGKRGKRGRRAEELLAELTGSESALIVNNCAAAAFLVLTVLASGGEVVISRGELVEIGGDFRVPDVLVQSGATLHEVGTTNRTKLSDYQHAVNQNTRLFLKVHPSNYRVVGFTAAPDLAELAALAHSHGLFIYEDAGSGALFDLSAYGLTDEPVISESIAAGVDVVSFSGDKLLGGVQSGLIVGRREVVERIRKHPLYRALRVDKLIYAALEATLEAFRREDALKEIPVLRMLAMTNEELLERTNRLAASLSEKAGNDLSFEIIDGKSVVGGGSAPDVQPATTLLSLKHNSLSAAKLEEKLRRSDPPVIARIIDDRVLLDLRTVSAEDENELFQILSVLQ